MLKTKIIGLFFLFCVPFTFGQIKQFDQLEVYYAQQHYKLVYRKSNRLLDNPDFDFSLVPKFYKSISMFQLAQQKGWERRHPGALLEAAELLKEIKRSETGLLLLTAHMYELSELKKDLHAWNEQLHNEQDAYLRDRLQKATDHLFDGIPDVDDFTLKSNTETETELALDQFAPLRRDLLETAKKFIGTPYVWGGTEPTGFDCSGFTGYVMKSKQITMPRRAVDQYKSSNKLTREEVMLGDLIFFDSGSGISHVGMVVSGKGQPLKMIHASSSKGITISNVDGSDYWTSRIAGFGTYIHD